MDVVSIGLVALIMRRTLPEGNIEMTNREIRDAW